MFLFCNLQTTVVIIMIIEPGVYIYLALLLTVNTEKFSGWYFYIIAVIGTTGDCPMTCFAFAFHWHSAAIQACPAMADACSPVRGDRGGPGQWTRPVSLASCFFSGELKAPPSFGSLLSLRILFAFNCLSF